jgi:hypothetical protein
MFLLMTGLCGMAQAAMVNYSITGATGNNWSGQFEVQSLDVTPSDWQEENVLSFSANGWEPILASADDTMFYAGFNSQGYVTWVNWDNDGPEYGLTLYSLELYADLVANNWGTTWNALNGKSYAIDTGGDNQTTFLGPEGSLTSTGGQISFSMSAVPEVSSSFTLLGLFTSGYVAPTREVIALIFAECLFNLPNGALCLIRHFFVTGGAPGYWRLQ